MYLVFVHDPLDLCDLCLWLDGLGCARHDVTHRVVEEFCLPFLHGTADVTIGDQSRDFIVH